MKLTYHRCGDYLLPDLCLTDEEQRPLGKYGRMCLNLSQGTPSRPVQLPPVVWQAHGASA